MAVDSAIKRAGLIGLFVLPLRIFPLPHAAPLTAFDRVHLAGLYPLGKFEQVLRQGPPGAGSFYRPRPGVGSFHKPPPGVGHS